MPKLPTFNPQKDGNPYEWIVRAAAERRAASFNATPGEQRLALAIRCRDRERQEQAARGGR